MRRRTWAANLGKERVTSIYIFLFSAQIGRRGTLNPVHPRTP